MFEHLPRRLDDQERAALRELIEHEQLKWFAFGAGTALTLDILFSFWRNL